MQSRRLRGRVRDLMLSASLSEMLKSERCHYKSHVRTRRCYSRPEPGTTTQARRRHVVVTSVRRSHSPAPSYTLLRLRPERPLPLEERPPDQVHAVRDGREHRVEARPDSGGLPRDVQDERAPEDPGGLAREDRRGDVAEARPAHLLRVWGLLGSAWG